MYYLLIFKHSYMQWAISEVLSLGKRTRLYTDDGVAEHFIIDAIYNGKYWKGGFLLRAN